MARITFELPADKIGASAVATAFAGALSHALVRLSAPDIREVLESTARDMQSFTARRAVPYAMDTLNDFVEAIERNRD